MPLPRPSSPKAVLADLRAFFAERSQYRLVSAALAVMLPIIIIIGFVIDGNTNIAPGEQLIYVESWSADRSDEEILAAQKERQAEREAIQAERQRQFQELEKRFGMD